MINIRTLFRWSFVLALLAAVVARTTAQEASGEESESHRSAKRDSGVASLSAQVRNIVTSSSLSHQKKEKRIAATLRVAIVSATAYSDNAAEGLEKAIQLASAAARVAPSYTEAICDAACFTPAVTRVDGGAGELRAAVGSLAQAPRTRVARVRDQDLAAEPVRPKRRKASATARPATPPPDEPSAEKDMSATSDEPPAPVRTARRRPPPAPEEAGNAPEETGYGPEFYPANRGDQPARVHDIAGNENSGVKLTADTSVRVDDNVFLAPSNKKSDVIYTLRPGVGFDWGQNSLSHGSLDYGIAFSRYQKKSAENSHLSDAKADIGYEGSVVTFSGDGSYVQSNELTRETAGTNTGVGVNQLFRTDTLDAKSRVEGSLTPKIGIGTGVAYNKIDYNSDALVGRHWIEVPSDLFYRVTPKTSVFAGATYRKASVENSDTREKDFYYNVGARGDFTEKLSGEVSVGYRTQSFTQPATKGSAFGAQSVKESTVGFNGSLSYELTPKTSSILQFSRDFNTSPLGQELVNSSYTFRVSSTLDSQWQFGAGVTYSNADYGPFNFHLASASNPNEFVERTDRYWQFDVQASYIITRWLSTSASFTLRNNHSTVQDYDFTDNIFSLMASFRY